MCRNKNLENLTPIYNQSNKHKNIYQNRNGKNFSDKVKISTQIINLNGGKLEPFLRN